MWLHHVVTISSVFGLIWNNLEWHFWWCGLKQNVVQELASLSLFSVKYAQNVVTTYYIRFFQFQMENSSYNKGNVSECKWWNKILQDVVAKCSIAHVVIAWLDIMLSWCCHCAVILYCTGFVINNTKICDARQQFWF